MRGDSPNCVIAMGLGLLVHYLLAFKRGFIFFFIVSTPMADIGIEQVNSARKEGRKGVGLLT